MEVKDEIIDPIAEGQSGPGLQVPISLIFLPEHTVEKPLEACRVCLLTDSRLYSMEHCNLKDMFKQLTGLRLLDDKYPSSLCAECATFLVKCKRFREKSLMVQKSLISLSNTTRTVTIEQIKRVKKRMSSKLSSNLSVKQSINYYDTEIYVPEDYQEESPTNLKSEKIYNDLKIDCEDNCVKLSCDSFVNQNPTKNFDTNINVCEDDEEEEILANVNGVKVKTEITTGCGALVELEYMKLPSNSSVKQNSSNNLDTDIFVCEDKKDVTSINIINGKQIKTEVENYYEKNVAKRELRRALPNLSVKEDPSDFFFSPYITYTYENYEKNTITNFKDNLLPIELFSDNDDNNSDHDPIKTETNHEQPEVNVSQVISKKKQTVEFEKADKADDGRKLATKTAKTSVGTYSCEQCGKVLKSKSVYLEHLQLEHHSSQHVCCICGLSFINKRGIREHKRRKHLTDNSHIPDNGPSCPECSLQFLSEEALQTHLQGKLKITRISVKNSDSEFGKDLNTENSGSQENEEYITSEIEIDVEGKGSDKKISTKIVKKSVPTRKYKSRRVPIVRQRTIQKNMIVVRKLSSEEQLEVIQKTREYYQNQPYICDICYFGTGLKHHLETHMMRHSKEMGEISCNFCHVRFKTSRAFSKHKHIHAYIYSCLKCPFTAYKRHIAVKHVRQFHEKQKFTCDKCGNVYRNLNNYFQHRKIKHPSSQHVCSLCGYSFSSKNGVETHHRAKHLLESIEMPTPTDGPSCAECSLRFMNEKALQTHMRVSHTTGTGKKMVNCCRIKGSVKSYKSKTPGIIRKVVCETCGKLVNTYQLKSHLEVHAGKSFSCSICGDTCRSIGAMYVHKYYKHGKGKECTEDARRCTVCEKTYSTGRNLSKHMARMHSGNKQHCNYCDKQYSCAESLKSHVDHVHLKKSWPKKPAK